MVVAGLRLPFSLRLWGLGCWSAWLGLVAALMVPPGPGRALAGYASPLSEEVIAVSAQVFCPKCGSSCPASDDYCRKCGAQLPRISCPKCGATTPASGKYCGTCGEELPEVKVVGRRQPVGRIIKYMARGLLLWFVSYWLLAAASVVILLIAGYQGGSAGVDGLRCVLILVAAGLAYLWERYLDRDK